MIYPNKVLGQNFLENEKIVDKMLSVANLSSEDLILEVGPGQGAITGKLLNKVKQVIAVEKDPELVKYLENKFKNTKNLKIISGDILQQQYSIFNIKYYKIISNLPFYLTSRFLRVFLELENKPTMMVLIIQKEVAQRICDQPPHASLLSNSVQFYAKPEIIDFVPKENFNPIPEVDAAIIKINVFKEPKIKVKDVNEFFKILKIGFSQKRKQLHNNFSSSLHINKEEAKKLLQKAGIDPERRAQTLSLEEWAEIYEEVRPFTKK
ncbi:MAG: 16S rRNA (adenine(1518)-N(6)/adenine(1519)-N(6))-dimethyltransferase RsmA [Patescibacteria group bacterium]|nr:16S rRNA (adenine(1518)-N(6)/adenine(1519)-N(6))-dimethyltransferase RsmA [Patescibacteria group bacterium]